MFFSLLKPSPGKCVYENIASYQYLLLKDLDGL